MDWEKIARLTKDVKATREELALLFLDTAAKIESSDDLIRLFHLFTHPRCNMDVQMIATAMENIRTYFTFEIHNHPSLSVPETMPGGSIRDILT